MYTLLKSAFVLHIVVTAKGLFCPGAEKWSNCKADCELTCQTIKNPPLCPSDHCEPGCVCPTELIRDERTKRCVQRSECPKDCQENEQWSHCGAACEPTCQTKENPPYCPASQACKSGCICVKDYIKDEVSNTCVRNNECPKDT